MTVEDTIRQKLMVRFAPSILEIVDESHHHAGHHGSSGAGETHFRIYMVSEVFSGQSRLNRHRAVNDALADELKGGVHALAIKAVAPEEH